MCMKFSNYLQNIFVYTFKKLPNLESLRSFCKRFSHTVDVMCARIYLCVCVCVCMSTRIGISIKVKKQTDMYKKG